MKKIQEAREIAGKHKGKFLEKELMPGRKKRKPEERDLVSSVLLMSVSSVLFDAAYTLSRTKHHSIFPFFPLLPYKIAQA
jgi:hypothetical protein